MFGEQAEELRTHLDIASHQDRVWSYEVAYRKGADHMLDSLRFR